MNLWEQYKSTVFLCHQQLADHIDFAIISAQNPAGRIENPYVNLRLDKELNVLLDTLHFPYRSITGAARDGSFQEKSWVVLCEKAQAVSMARRFQQNAIYWVEDGVLYLVPVLLNANEECLGRFKPRLFLV